MAWWVFQNVVATAILAMVVALVCRTFRISPGIRHALWMLVLIKFVTPPVLTWPWQVPDPLGIQALDVRAETTVALNSTAESANPSGAQVPPPSRKASADRGQTQGPDASAAAGSAGSDRAEAGVLSNLRARAKDQGLSWLLVVWAAGAIVVLIVEAIRLLRVARAVRSARSADPRIVERVRVLSARLDIPPVPVLTMPTTTSPAMWCLGRPRLLWPSELPADFTDACIDGLIVHELAHVKRRDHIVGWIELGASVIWWWNPLFWWVRSALREQAELACDGWVIAALPNGRRAYAESLLALSSAAIVDEPASPMSAVFGVRARSRRALERRLVMIMKGRASRRLSVLGLVGLGMVAIATLPVWAAGQQTPPPPPASVPVVVAPPVALTTAQTLPPTAAPLPSTAVTAARPPVLSVPQSAPPSPASAPTRYPSPMTATSAPAALPPAPAGRPGVAMAPSQAQTTTPAPTPVPARPRGAVGTPQGATTVPVVARDVRMTYVARTDSLPADAQTQVKSYETERAALQQEIDRKLEAKRADLTKSLQALQDSYTKAGKLDEAVAIRDYIRSLTGGRVVYRPAR